MTKDRRRRPAKVAPVLVEPDEQAGHHRQTRLARQTEIAEDYVELIADLIDSTGEARSADISRRLGVTHANVTKTVARLQQGGLVTTQPYRAIFLTDEGRRIAEASRRRHQIVVAFLQAIGVSEDVARADAEGIEHHVSEETLAAFERMVTERGRES
ncbi:MAG: manganese-binding transcriptional regulator MntR [Defluviicoccus sp.]|nr:manganese-binding transcriptional regulator MntR [Defluviicoccus sp.]